jgi:hypothetical protein
LREIFILEPKRLNTVVPDTLWGPNSLLCNRNTAISPGLSGRSVKLTPPPPISEKVEKTCIYTSTSPHVFMA